MLRVPCYGRRSCCTPAPPGRRPGPGRADDPGRQPEPGPVAVAMQRGPRGGKGGAGAGRDGARRGRGGRIDPRRRGRWLDRRLPPARHGSRQHRLLARRTQGRGLLRAIAPGWVDAMRRRLGATCVWAATQPGNQGSRGVMAACGLRPVRTEWMDTPARRRLEWVGGLGTHLASAGLAGLQAGQAHRISRGGWARKIVLRPIRQSERRQRKDACLLPPLPLRERAGVRGPRLASRQKPQASPKLGCMSHEECA